MSISVGGLANLCSNNLVELRFTRRDKRRRPTTRRMLCTIDFKLLNSPLGKQLLNFTKPFNRPPYNAAEKGLVTVWDLIMQNWRNVPTETCIVVSVISTTPQKKFWEYYDRVIVKMTPQQKSAFMDK
jgi:hypothetical protein